VGRKLRDTQAGKLHLITCRTHQAELLLVPNPELNDLIGGIIALYARKYSITIYAVCILGNHYHLLVSGPEAILPIFAANINREIARRTNWLLFRTGSLWARRYSDQVAIEQVDALEGLIYVITNPVHHGLVTHPRHWPGVNSYWQVLGEKPRVYSFIYYTEYHRAKRRAECRGEIVRREDYEIKTPLEIQPLPIFSELSDKERIEQLGDLLEARTGEIVRRRRQDGKGFMGRREVLRQARRGSFPTEVKTTPQPSCYSKNPERIKEHRAEERQKRAWYDIASERFRSGDYGVEFPPYCFKPPLHYVPAEVARGPT